MAQQSDLIKNEKFDVPLESFEDETSKLNDPSTPPEYESPRLEFNKGCKDRGFAISFWIYIIVVIVVGLVLGIPAIQTYMEHTKTHDMPTKFNVNMTLLLYLVAVPIAISGLISFILFFFLQLCASQMIMFSLIFTIVLQLILVTLFILIGLWPAAGIPLIILVVTIIFVLRIRKQIKFAGINIQIACEVLRQHPSLLFVAIFTLILQFLWFIIWFLLAIGILHAVDRPLFDQYLNRLTSTSSDHIQTTSTTTTVIQRPYQYDTNQFSEKEKSKDHLSNMIAYVIIFLAFFVWYWATMTFANIGHFVSACAVGHWWFPNDTNEQYRISRGLKRAFTTNFGTIAFGSFFEALVKALRKCISKNGRGGWLTICIQCILSLIEKIIGYINEWAFIFSALTGQSFIKAGKNFFNLLTKRGWTMIINDMVIGNCLGLVNFTVALTTAIVTGICCYFFMSTTSEQILPSVLIFSFTAFMLGLSLNVTLTTILKSCAQAAFICFALNPAALGATHPDYLYRLTQIWQELYPNEFATSGYSNQFSKVPSSYNV